MNDYLVIGLAMKTGIKLMFKIFGTCLAACGVLFLSLTNTTVWQKLICRSQNGIFMFGFITDDVVLTPHWTLNI